MLRVISITLIGIALLVFLYAGQEFRRVQPVFPQNSRWGGLDVSGLTIEEARQRVLAVYLAPFELYYENQIIQASAESLGFWVDLLESEILSSEFNLSFWEYLWGGWRPPVEWQVDFRLDKTQLTTYLQSEIASRYDVIPTPPLPIPASSRFEPGISGKALDIDASLSRFEEVLQNPHKRRIELVVREGPAGIVDADWLKAVLTQELRMARFDGIAEIYAYHLSKHQSLHFAIKNGEEVPTEIAFSAASTIKIPILLTALMQIEPPFPDEFTQLAERMMVYSENPPADRIMESYIGSTLAPLKVTEMLQEAGFQNTFLAGYFYLGAPLLRRFDTPANQRLDINLNPDVYNQTTAGEMGELLKAIYQCADSGSGLLMERFAGRVMPEKCAFILEMMKRNRIGVLGQAGLPEGLPFAHKHGWSEESDGYLHTISDVGVVYGPQADYVMVIFLYDPVQLLFEPANALMARLSQRIYNAWNLDYQIEWMFGEVSYR